MYIYIYVYIYIYIRGDHGRPGPPARSNPARKSEGLGVKIWPDGRVWVENKWPDFFWDGFGIWCLARGPARPGPKKCVFMICILNLFYIMYNM